MKLNSLTERQRVLLLHAVSTVQISRTMLFIIDPEAKAVDILEDINYLAAQLRNGKGS